jgi:hypothetical protein
MYTFGKRVNGEADSYAPSSSYEMKSLSQYKNAKNVNRNSAWSFYARKRLSEFALQNQHIKSQKFVIQGVNDPVSMQSPTILNYNNTDTKDDLRKKRRGSAILENYHQSMVSYKKQLANSVRTNYMLVLVSKWFILLHVPYFISWCFMHVQLKRFESMRVNDADSDEMDAGQTRIIMFKAFVNIFEILFSLNYSINFFVYLIHGPLFRKIHADILSHLLKSISNLLRKPQS